MPAPIKVLLVDDSIVIRSALKKILTSDAEIDVIASVGNGMIGYETAKRENPDIVILDIEMPVMDGITALPKILEGSPNTKVIMFSTLTEKGAEITMKALRLGAVECLAKPSAEQRVDTSDDFQNHLIALVRSLCGRSTRSVRREVKPSITDQASGAASTVVLNKNPHLYTGKPSLLAIGSSTGGPNALFEVLSHIKNPAIPIVITQHMPPTFTKILAGHIAENTGLPSHEGEEGMILQNGHVYVAPGDFHMEFEQTGAGIAIRLNKEPPVNYCRPSVDPMIKSAVKIYKNRVLGVILTGMGNDGIGGGEAIFKNNGMLIAQDKDSCTVYGMPKAVAEAGYCHKILPLKDIGPWLKMKI